MHRAGRTARRLLTRLRLSSLLTPPAELLTLAALLLMLTWLTGCASVSRAPDPCVAFEPITTTRVEQMVLSAETMAQIDAHNAVWLELCD